MFWSLILEPGKRYSSTVKESFHLSMATLDVKSCKNDNEIHPVSIQVEGEELLLCNLSKSTSPHASLDLMFEKGNEITFFTKGKATVHLTGYCLREEIDISDEEDDYDSSVEEEEESNDKIGFRSAQSELADKSKNKHKQKANKRKLESCEAVSKKKHKGGKSESDDDDDDDSDDLSGDLDDSKLDQLVDSINAEDDSSDENDEDDSDIDDEEDENSDDSEGEDEVDDEDEDDEDSSDSEEERGQKQKKKPEVKTSVSNKQKTPTSNKKHEKQNKHELTNGTTPQSNKKDKNKNQANQQTPKQAALKTPNKDGQKSPKKGESTPQSQKKQTLSGGVVVEELKPGSGQPAKYGKVVQVYYTGRLKNNNRVFDQSTQGPGFKFRLGTNEVIKGWDVALNGMKVGGKRRITIPPTMAYGSKGSPPQIPPNSWLVFDVELKSVN